MVAPPVTLQPPRAFEQVGDERRGTFGSSPCRDLAFWPIGMFATRALAAHLDPLAPTWAVTVFLSMTAGLLVLLVAAAAYDAATGKLRNRSLVKAESVPVWARPGGRLTVALAVIGVLYPLLVVVGLTDDSLSLSDHVASASILVYFGLALRLQWAVTTGRMPSRVPVQPLTRWTRRLLTASAVLIAIAVVAVIVAAPGIVRRDQVAADCRENNLVALDMQRLAGAGLSEADLRARTAELALRLRPCEAS